MEHSHTVRKVLWAGFPCGNVFPISSEIGFPYGIIFYYLTATKYHHISPPWIGVDAHHTKFNGWWPYNPQESERDRRCGYSNQRKTKRGNSYKYTSHLVIRHIQGTSISERTSVLPKGLPTVIAVSCFGLYVASYFTLSLCLWQCRI